MISFFHGIFYSMYEWNIKVVKNKDYPEFATGIQTALCVYLFIEFIIDLLLFLFVGELKVVITTSKILGFLVLTTVIIFVFWYGSKRRKKIEDDIADWSKKKKNFYKIGTVLFLLALMSYMIVLGIINRA